VRNPAGAARIFLLSHLFLSSDDEKKSPNSQNHVNIPSPQMLIFLFSNYNSKESSIRTIETTFATQT
jgi:hypothetical protein